MHTHGDDPRAIDILLTLMPSSMLQIPEELTKYYLSKSGFVTEDPRL
jgi:hypothetical protein